MDEINPTVWADGFGRWHASVPLSGSRARDAQLARRKIIDEIAYREGRARNRIKVSVTRERVTNHGTAIYGEK